MLRLIIIGSSLEIVDATVRLLQDGNCPLQGRQTMCNACRRIRWGGGSVCRAGELEQGLGDGSGLIWGDRWPDFRARLA
jgi:hypothetical protein